MGDTSVCILGGVWALGSQDLQGLWLGVACTVAMVAGFLVAGSRPLGLMAHLPYSPQSHDGHVMASRRHILLLN